MAPLRTLLCLGLACCASALSRSTISTPLDAAAKFQDQASMINKHVDDIEAQMATSVEGVTKQIEVQQVRLDGSKLRRDKCMGEVAEARNKAMSLNTAMAVLSSHTYAKAVIDISMVKVGALAVERVRKKAAIAEDTAEHARLVERPTNVAQGIRDETLTALAKKAPGIAGVTPGAEVRFKAVRGAIAPAGTFTATDASASDGTAKAADIEAKLKELSTRMDSEASAAQKIAANHKRSNEDAVASLDARIAALHLKMRKMRTKNVEIIAELKDKRRESMVMDADLERKVSSCDGAIREGQDAKKRIEVLKTQMAKTKGDYAKLLASAKGSAERTKALEKIFKLGEDHGDSAMFGKLFKNGPKKEPEEAAAPAEKEEEDAAKTGPCAKRAYSCKDAATMSECGTTAQDCAEKEDPDAAVEATELAKDALKKATVCVEATWCQDEATMKLCGMTSATCGKNADGSKDDGSGKPVVPDAAAQADLQVKEDASAVAAAEKEGMAPTVTDAAEQDAIDKVEEESKTL